jgi:mannose-6-phosphate isomerase-like protein (cupin superfamily)
VLVEEDKVFKVINSGRPFIYESTATDLYQYKVYGGTHNIVTSPLSSYWYIDDEIVVSETGNGETLSSSKMCVEIYGYTPETRTSSFNRGTDLPYINGCSAKQLITPVRPGDPTFQMLHIPPFCSEQEHHIHATPRVVYITEGAGVSVVGTPEFQKEYELNVGDIILLSKMTPHHFKTTDSKLVVLPIHIFSSIASAEFDHPMYNGTHRV